MPDHEISIIKFLLENRKSIQLPHIDMIRTIHNPNPSGAGKTLITNIEQLGLISPGDSRKKADIYINEIGVSIKQSGGSFAYNRLQRANLYDVYKLMDFSNITDKLHQIDTEVDNFHNGDLERRNRLWENFFTEEDFKSLLQFLMTKGSPNVGISDHPATFILQAPSVDISNDNISVFTFNEYFDQYKNKFQIAIRRQWVGQASNSEHTRALGLSKKPGNEPWVYNNVVGNPRTGWRPDWPVEERKTVYFLMIEKIV